MATDQVVGQERPQLHAVTIGTRAVPPGGSARDGRIFQWPYPIQDEAWSANSSHLNTSGYQSDVGTSFRSTASRPRPGLQWAAPLTRSGSPEHPESNHRSQPERPGSHQGFANVDATW